VAATINIHDASQEQYDAINLPEKTAVADDLDGEVLRWKTLDTKDAHVTIHAPRETKEAA